MLPEAALVAASVALLLVAAKAHGRSVRLVREDAGFHDVEFGGANPPFVVALWRADRRRYWTLAPLFAFAFVGVLALRGVAWPGLLLAGGLWAPSAAFVVAGLAVGSAGVRRRNAAWWAATAAAAVLVAVLAATLP